MGAPCMVVVNNLAVAFLEVRMFTLLPELFPRDFVAFFTQNYFRFIDDVIHKWLEHFDIEKFAEVINSLDPEVDMNQRI